MRTSLSLLCAASLAALSCSDGGSGPPRPGSMEPSSGLASQSTPVIIRGDGFLARPSEQQSGGGETIDARHRAWLDDAELDGVIWIDAHTLQAVVPAGLPAGPKRLLVENAFGQRGAVESAFTVIRAGSQTPAALSATLAVQGSPSTVLVGQALSVTLTVSNTGQGGASVTTVTPTVSPAGAATCGLPSPAPPQTIAGGGSTNFTWTCTATTAGSLTLGATVAGTATTGGAALQATAPGVALTVQLPAELTATVATNRNTANVGQAVTVTLTLTNGGTSTANVTSITRSTTGVAANCTAPSPASASVPTGGTRNFTWNCTPSASGTLTLSATAAGTDAVSGGAISATPAAPATVLVQAPAAITASLAALPTSVVVGQAVALTLTVQNSGGASAVISSVAPLKSGAAATCGLVSPTTPQTIAGGASTPFTWTCTPSAQGTLTLDATVSASDANTGATSSPPVAAVSVTVLTPAALTATIDATPSTVDVGQDVNVTFTLTNGGSSAADVTTITPVVSGGTAAATCTAASPAALTVPAGQSLPSTWTCTPTTAGTLSLSGTASGTDAVSGAPITATPAASASVLVQVPAVLTATLTPSATSVKVPGSVTLSLSVQNSGPATTQVTSVTLSNNPGGANIDCGAVTPTPPLDAVAGSPALFSWSCTLLKKATDYALGATVTAIDPTSNLEVIVPVLAVTVRGT